MGDIRDRLQKLERLVADKLVCAECSRVSIVVIGPGEDAASKTPGPCPTCGRERSVLVVVSPLVGDPGSARKASSGGIDLVGSPQIDAEDNGKVIGPPN
jgi:hypothetical protein